MRLEWDLRAGVSKKLSGVVDAELRGWDLNQGRKILVFPSLA